MEEFYNAFLQQPVVAMNELGHWYRNDPNVSETFSLNRADWTHAYNDGHPLEAQVDDRIYTSGVYCFWYRGSAEDLAEYNAIHYIQGQQGYLEDPRLEGTDIQCLWTGTRENQKREVIDVYHLFHPVTWQFHQREVGGELLVPLYVGKASNIFKRVKQHLAWPGRNHPVAQVHPIVHLPMALKPPGNTVAQMRAGFEFLFQNEDDQNKRLRLQNNIALSIFPFDFIDFQNRFYFENYLIGMLRPPFNVDSER